MIAFTNVFLQGAQAAPVPAPAAPAPVPPDPGLLPPDIPAPVIIDGDLLQEQTAQAVQEALRAAEEAQRFQFQFGPGDPWFMLPDQLMPLVLGSLLLILLMIVGYPIARAIGRRIDRAAPDPLSTLQPVDVMARLERIEHAVETMAVEIERISEGQRFTNRMFAERAKELGSRGVTAEK